MKSLLLRARVAGHDSCKRVIHPYDHVNKVCSVSTGLIRVPRLLSSLESSPLTASRASIIRPCSGLRAGYEGSDARCRDGVR